MLPKNLLKDFTKHMHVLIYSCTDVQFFVCGKQQSPAATWWLDGRSDLCVDWRLLVSMSQWEIADINRWQCHCCHVTYQQQTLIQIAWKNNDHFTSLNIRISLIQNSCIWVYKWEICLQLVIDNRLHTLCIMPLTSVVLVVDAQHVLCLLGYVPALVSKCTCWMCFTLILPNILDVDCFLQITVVVEFPWLHCLSCMMSVLHNACSCSCWRVHGLMCPSM